MRIRFDLSLVLTARDGSRSPPLKWDVVGLRRAFVLLESAVSILFLAANLAPAIPVLRNSSRVDSRMLVAFPSNSCLASEFQS